MFSHVTLGISDINRALNFYRPLMQALGWEERWAPRTASDEPWAGYVLRGTEWPQFVINEPFDGRAPSAGNGTMVAFEVDARAAVDRAHALALDLGGRDEGAPGLRPQYHAHYYGAYFRDPDRNKLCVVCHRAE